VSELGGDLLGRGLYETMLVSDESWAALRTGDRHCRSRTGRAFHRTATAR
jgi:hypothetical protein